MIRRILLDDWWKALAYLAILAANMVATVCALPSFEANYTMIVNLIPDFVGVLKRALEDAGQGGLPAFVAVNHFFKGANVIGPAMAIVLALGTVVREVEIGTIGLLLSRPISRPRILFGFASIHLLELLLPLVIVTLLIPVLSGPLVGRELPLAPLLPGLLHACSFVTLVYAIALFCAVALPDQIKVAAAAGGVCIVSFLLYFIEATRDFTLYRLSSLDLYVSVAKGASVRTGELLLVLGLCAAFFGATTLWFRTRDY